MRRLALCFFIIASAVLILAVRKTNHDLPNPIGYVNDFAAVIDADAKDKMEALCSELDKKANAQIAVVTVKTLAGSSIEDYALHLFNHWGIGHKEDNRGLLILLSISERKYRIEVGRGFETLFPNERVAKIGAQMVPDLKAKRYGQALLSCARALAIVAADEKHVQLNSVADKY